MPKKILLVEDEAIIALSETQMLKRHGYEVVTVHEGQTAIEVADADSSISLVLMDIDLGPGIDGTEAAQTILERHDLPIVFLSSHTEPEVVEKTECITSYGYILKNSGETVLLTSIRMAFRLYNAHRLLKDQKEKLRHTLVQVEQTEQVLLEREELYRRLMENSVDAVQLLDERGRFLDVNDRGCEMIGYSREELLCMTIADIDPNYPGDGFYRFWVEKPKGTSILFETTHRHKDGTLISVEVNGIFFEVNKKRYLFGVARDITERKEHQRRIAESEQNLRVTLNSIGDAVIVTDRLGRVTRMNPIAEALCEWPRDEAIGRPLPDVFRIINADTRREVANPATRVMETGRTVGLANHTVLIARGGSEHQIADSAAPIVDEAGEVTGVVLVFRDVTEQYETDRKLRETAESLESFLRHSPLLMSEIDPRGRYIRVNPALARVVGTTPSQVEGKRFEEVLPAELARTFERRVAAVRESHQPVRVEDTVATDNGSRPYVTTLFPLVDPDGTLRSIGAVAHDIGDYRRMEESLRDALRSKEALMRELSHRAKNNLNLLASLISIKDAETREDLSDIRHRIQAIGLVHEKLHQHDGVQLVSVREYVQDLLEAVFSSLTSQDVRIMNEVDDVRRDPRTVVPLGLIVNEIATNAIKHGFRADEEPCFTVRFTSNPEGPGDTLTLSNTGAPFPEEVDLKNPNTLGLQLIVGLTEQLGGTIELRKRPHPVFTIRLSGGIGHSANMAV
ncbi:MAG: PAS domain S-box protein [Spirochaetota bacterium]